MINAIIKNLLFFSSCIFLYGCSNEFKIVEKIESKNNKYVAYIYKQNGGGTLSDDEYEVYVKEFSKPFDEKKLVFIGASPSKVSLYWRDEKTLFIEFCNGKSIETNSRYDFYNSRDPRPNTQIYIQDIRVENIDVGGRILCKKS